MKGLSADAVEVETLAIELVGNDGVRLVSEYRRLFGVTVSTDSARELFPDNSASIDSRLQYAAAVQRSAASLAALVFETIVREESGGASGGRKVTPLRPTGDTLFSVCAIHCKPAQDRLIAPCRKEPSRKNRRDPHTFGKDLRSNWLLQWVRYTDDTSPIYVRCPFDLKAAENFPAFGHPLREWPQSLVFVFSFDRAASGSSPS
jgi:hypothetical protein